MAIGLIGRKRGMTRIFTAEGGSTPVTVLEVEPNRVAQRKTREVDGYDAVQLTVGTKRSSRLSKALAGHYAKASVPPGRGLWEFRLNEGEGADLLPGSEVNVTFFTEGQLVDVAGTTIGKGFAGTVKRHNFAMKDATHGNSLSHRTPGSIGQNQTPGRVFKGKRMAGQMGNCTNTIQNLEIIRVDEARNLLLLKGSVPGAKGGDVIIRHTVKAKS